MTRMKAFEDVTRKFSNQRQWRDFIAAVQCSVNYPAVICQTLGAAHASTRCNVYRAGIRPT
jgi:hypothetical protein